MLLFPTAELLLLLLRLVTQLNSRLYKRFSELSRLATNIECIDQLMDLLRLQHSMDEILALLSQASSSQVHGKIAELLHTLLHVSHRSIRRTICNSSLRNERLTDDVLLDADDVVEATSESCQQR